MAIRGIAVIDVEKDFSWGSQVKTYILENILIIAYHPQIFKNNCGTGRYSRRVNYHVYLHTDAYKKTPDNARRAKVNGAPRLWKRSPARIEIPLKYGMYEFATITESDIEAGRLLVEVGFKS